MKKKLALLLSFPLVFTAAAFCGDDAQALRQKVLEARSLLFDQKYQLALDRFEAILKTNGDNLEAQLGKMDALGGLRNRDQINSIASTKVANSVDAMVVSANSKIWNRDFPGAESDLRKAIEQDGQAYLAHYLLGYVQYRTKQESEAIKSLEKAIQINKDFPEAYYLLGDLYFKKGESTKVFQYWRDYLERIPQSGSRFDYVSSTLQKMGGH